MDSAVAHRAASLYGADSSDLAPLRGGNAGNAYRFFRDGRPCVLRIASAGEDLDLPSARAIVAWLLYLGEHGGPVPRPVASTRGRLVEELSYDGGDLVITALEEANGVLGERLPAGARDSSLCSKLGGAIGRMHRISSCYIPPEGLPRRPEWDSIGSCFNPSSLTAYDGTPISDRRAEMLLLIGELPRDEHSYGLIHADLHCANLCVETGSGLVTFFDFDDSCYGWYAMDIAMSLFDAVVLYGEAGGGGFPEMFLGSYLSGYVSETPLQPFWVEQLPLFLKLLEIGVYTQVERAYQSGTDDEWIRRFMPGRRERIVENVPFVDLRFPEVAASIRNPWSRSQRAAG
jgi:Ser/Thr protein kinase RdoA (MazF antagonist)